MTDSCGGVSLVAKVRLWYGFLIAHLIAALDHKLGLYCRGISEAIFGTTGLDSSLLSYL